MIQNFSILSLNNSMSITYEGRFCLPVQVNKHKIEKKCRHSTFAYWCVQLRVYMCGKFEILMPRRDQNQ